MSARYGVAVCAAAFLATACGYSIKTSTDYDRTVSFSTYHTFAILKGNSSGDLLMDHRAQADVERVLTSKGWIEVEDGLGQAAVVIHAATRDRHTFDNLYDGWGGWRWRWGGFADRTTFVETYKVGTLVVDIFDARTKQAIWHGFATDALSDAMTSNFNATEQAVRRMFSDFPPGSQAIAARR